jgi:hypothetical protein
MAVRFVLRDFFLGYFSVELRTVNLEQQQLRSTLRAALCAALFLRQYMKFHF